MNQNIFNDRGPVIDKNKIDFVNPIYNLNQENVKKENYL